MTSMTSPQDTGTGRAGGADRESSTSPLVAPDALRATEQVAAVTAGIATQYWDEVVPTSGNPRLWLLVDNGWRLLQNPSLIAHDMVQRAFLGADSVVRVWYDGQNVVGLVVSGS